MSLVGAVYLSQEILIFDSIKGKLTDWGCDLDLAQKQAKQIIGSGEIKDKMFSVPVEINYILGKRNFSFEIGYGITWIHIDEESSFKFLNDYYTNESGIGNYFVSYLPLGFRVMPKIKGFMLKFNIGPVFNYSSPNMWSENNVDIYAGIAVGYSFFK